MHQYDWAVNNIKLQLSILAITQKNKLDPRIEISEENIKANYIARGGLLTQDVPEKEIVEVSTDEGVKTIVKAKRTKK